MFKDAFSLPGLAYKMLMNCPNAIFSLFEEQAKIYLTILHAKK
jgi:hypothetical protein